MQKKPTRDTRDFGDKLSDSLGVERKNHNTKPFRPRTEAPRYNRKNEEVSKDKPARNNANGNGVPYFQLPDKRSIGADGVNHINCSSKGLTSIGRSLSSHSNANFQHRFAGPFRTMEGFIWYLRTEDDVFRTMPGNIVAKHGNVIRHQESKEIPRDLERFLVADAYWNFVSAREDLVAAIKDSEAPFDVYNVDQSGIRIRVYNADWRAHIFELIRKGIKEGHYPYFFELFNPYSAYGKEQVNKKFKEAQNIANEVHQIDFNSFYKEVANNIVKEHFEGLIDYNQLRALQTQNLQNAAMKASKQILNQTAKAFSEANKGRGNKNLEHKAGANKPVSEAGSERITHDNSAKATGEDTNKQVSGNEPTQVVGEITTPLYTIQLTAQNTQEAQPMPHNVQGDQEVSAQATTYARGERPGFIIVDELAYIPTAQTAEIVPDQKSPEIISDGFGSIFPAQISTLAPTEVVSSSEKDCGGCTNCECENNDKQENLVSSQDSQDSMDSKTSNE